MRRSKRVRMLVMTAACAALMGVLAPWTVPLGPVPVSLCSLLIYVMAYLTDWKGLTAAVLVYVLMGLVGLPVFAGFTGGLGSLAGPTGGFIAGYLPMGVLCALAANKGHNPRHVRFFGMVAATAVLYAFGTAWFCAQAQVGLWSGIAVCVLPFLPADSAKLLAAAVIGPALAQRMSRAGLDI